MFVPLANQPRMRSQGKVVLERNQDMRGGGRGRGRRQRGKGWLSSLGDAIDVGKGAYGIYRKLTGGRMKGGMTTRDVKPAVIRRYQPGTNYILGGRRRQRGKGLLEFLL